MGLGLMIFLLFCLLVLGAWAIDAVTQAKARHRQEMADLIRGRNTGQNVNKAGLTNLSVSPLSPPETDSSIYSHWAQQANKKATAKVTQNQPHSKGSRSRHPGPCTMNISYVDAKGAWSHRNVAPYKSGATNARFDAWCDTQKARRTFYFEQIQCGTDLRTGRQLSQAGVFQLIHPSRSIPPGFE